MLVSKSLSIVGRATLIAEKSLAITTTAIPIAKRANQVERGIGLEETSLAMRAAYAKLRRPNDAPARQPRASPSPPPPGGIALGGALAAREKVIRKKQRRRRTQWHQQTTQTASTSSIPHCAMASNRPASR